MPITDILEKNCRLYGDDVALVEINPEMPETKRTTWKEFDLIEPSRAAYYRREITWNVFNEKANRFANLLIERGIKKGEKVDYAILKDNEPIILIEAKPCSDDLSKHDSQLFRYFGTTDLPLFCG